MFYSACLRRLQVIKKCNVFCISVLSLFPTSLRRRGWVMLGLQETESMGFWRLSY